MLYSNKNRVDVENLNELVSLQNQVKVLRLQDNLGKQNFHDDTKKVFESDTKTTKNVSEDVTNTKAETSKQNNKELVNLNDTLFEILNDKGIIASYLLSPLSKITQPKHTSLFKLVNDLDSNRINDLLITKTTPISLYDILLSFHDTDTQFELERDLLNMINRRNYNIDLANLPERKLLFEFAKEM